MKFRPLLTALFAATAFSPPSNQSLITNSKSDTSTYCLPVPGQHASATIIPRMQRPRPGEVSLGASASSNITKTNSPVSSAIPPPPAWVLTLEEILTATFRVVITVLTLFNVNVTWRIRADLDRRPRGLRHAWAGVRVEIV
ncbi:hypothetical protein IMSHALPRED_000853 [Imshaugia aleurites]|uniref:Uncharacterized protein n=1 Tax=Imshaugia aleurites TaxID=172621 RepID=A0A8H3EWA4_9LECA|nr:hypothetical protein IMSHALPRED_000853 [Imshaugia aleurites]